MKTTLSALLHDFCEIPPKADCDITGLTLDSRHVKAGDLFFACVGTQLDGRQFIDKAILNGAKAVLSEGDAANPSVVWQGDVPIIFIKNLNHQVGKIAARFFQYPAKSLRIVGISGTNGKTSCSHFVAAALTRQGITCGVIGTLGNGLYGNIHPTNLTTPDAITLQAIFADFVTQGAKAVAMEVSSHSLDQGRVDDIPFEVAIFTNLTRDHLDYHGDMATYGAAKKRLYDNALLQHAVINADDDFGQALIQTLHATQDIYAYRVKQSESLSVPTIFADKVHSSIMGLSAVVHTPWGEGQLQTSLIGQFNLSNVLAVLTTLCVMGVPFEAALASLAGLQPVPGRMEALGGQDTPLVVVDYSHTPDALEKALLAIRQHCEGKLYCLFGCGGDRDRGKRPIMAKIAEDYADYVVVTDDNPRHEDPKQIMTDILQGFVDPSKVIVQHDRSKAIQDIIQCAKAGDCILVAGKGAETYQQIGDTKIPFSDVAHVAKFL
ncbi:MAG: UDP-N-acetylmuramoyl-L-alanyl-D-glutamate--2,6-diaminopimelate ligase [Gammaproteobacteria bacterium]|nr:UDP-N-acetylmuramoyl-L-alanyl-D-glutamate--2,6-diaminopimelate ligase [Gammaproteobacteria bacterium]